MKCFNCKKEIDKVIEEKEGSKIIVKCPYCGARVAVYNFNIYSREESNGNYERTS